MRKKPDIVIIVDGGLVTEVRSDAEVEVSVTIVDFDNLQDPSSCADYNLGEGEARELVKDRTIVFTKKGRFTEKKFLSMILNEKKYPYILYGW